MRDTSRLRALIAEDRQGRGELRSASRPVPLVESEYTTPLHVLWRRYLRARRKSLRGSWRELGAVGLSLAAALALSGFFVFAEREESARVKAGSHALAAASTTPSTSPSQRSKQALSAHAPVQPAELSRHAGLSTKMRLVRADALLRNRSQRAAREARALLETTLPDVPRDAHGRAALAEACLRLRDAPCAHAAITEALELRPLRSRYRALARRVERVLGPKAP